ncbi:MAG: SGNH/GDSL hydrolase family protein [Gammaproteobacteria bacterium]|nr:SGNH/GDSL hydrolase family protein [Gammaproteobacteria bacterium]
MKKILSAALLALFFAGNVSATTFTNMFIFGDSLSDTGNIAALSSFPVSPPYDSERFSNGLVWVDYLAANLGLAAVPSTTAGGNNYAFGGAQTGTGAFPPSLISQANLYLNDVSGAADADALYVVWGGGNDVRDNIAGSASNIETIVSTLAAAGATNFLIPNLPDIGMTPEALAGMTPGCPTNDPLECSLFMSGVTNDHNTALETAMTGLAASDPSLNIVFFDVFSLFNMMLSDPAAFGFSVTDTACYSGEPTDDGLGSVCANPGDHVFWDGIHPTTDAHALLGDLAFDELTQVVPIPGAVWLFASALLGLGGMRRRNK